jgi:uncharacterized protein (TIGR02996 family)
MSRRPPRLELLALLDDVKRNPNDLTPWLVLCDWLEENGDEVDRARGEYCRLCFDKLGKRTFASDWEKGERRRELFRTYRQAWFGPILELNPTMRKGLAEIYCSFCEIETRLARLLEVEEAWAWVGWMQVGGKSGRKAPVSFTNALRKGQCFAAMKALAGIS